MKSRLFLYLFIFASLIALYQFVSANTMVEENTKTINTLHDDKLVLQDSIKNLHLKMLEIEYFSLNNNDDALAYYEHLNLTNPTSYITDKLLETNEGKGDNPLVPYEGMEGKFKINKIKVLNHKWIVADFSDGKYWGDLLIKYELKDDLGVDFSLTDHLLYAR
ncbi:hydrolase [Cellulophaga sp. HaHaR_3_176]|uniref:hydrolase n=1 Tax=Cellulophaga sp. HaHaR_3_176 TaxID=1942464 RepID=UPI001C1F5221|nr:hydrolase [Cellulophaga sp. HaHaR_3_176]QWX85421.1 hydrolase [Cellulophaga sp. HaHaR_3_176]